MTTQRPKPHLNRSAMYPGQDPETPRSERPESDSATAVAERPQAQDHNAGKRVKGKQAKAPKSSTGRRPRA
jgi:hypothetical protein